MSIVILQVPEVKYSQSNRPTHCPYCAGDTFQRWGGVAKPVRDPHFSEAWVYRYRCCRCKRTFRHYPDGVSRADQTRRMQVLAVLGWVLGMSYRGLVGYLKAFGVPLERMSAWRDVQAQAEAYRKERQWKPVRVLGLDGAYVRGWGETQAVLVAVDLGSGQPVALGYADEKDPKAVRRFLEPLVQRLGVSVVVTDDLESYKVVVEQLDLEQQICQFHLRRWTGRTLRELTETIPEEWRGMVGEVQQILEELPIWGEKRLVELWRQLPAGRQGHVEDPYAPLDRLRYLLARLMGDYPHYRVFDWQPDVPWTNNATERAIGRMKMRARTVRGYKNWPGMHHGLWVSGMGIG
jgi:transposase-like protein